MRYLRASLVALFAVAALFVGGNQSSVSADNCPPGYYACIDGVPFNGDVVWVDVAPGEVKVLTGGPVCIDGICAPGGENRGTILVIESPFRVTRHMIYGLWPGSNWLASSTMDVNSVINDRIPAMRGARNCTAGFGCGTLDIIEKSTARGITVRSDP